ncbi:MAG TPA: glutamine amidotransferase, partial [Gemmataceae bacterium]|nr:glutamine amidotransferase [Gemmataceae bacterium]
ARAVLETTARLRSKPLVAVVLVSDGMDNTGRQDFRELEALPVPVHTVGFPPDTAADSLDLAIKSVQAPERAMVHNEIKVECLVTKSGGPATNATVLIKRGRETLASQNVAFAAGDGEQKISVPFTPAQPGSFVFTAAVESEAGDRAPANNSRHFPLRVDAEPIRVLYLEGFLRYEFKFLKDRLEDDPDIGLVSLVRRAHPEQADARPSQEFLTPDRLKHFHVVILGDMEANYLTQPEYQALVRWLDEKGHALLVIGGYHSFGPDGFRSTPLADVLPVIFAEKPPYQSEEAFTLKLTEEGRRHPIFELSKDRLKDAATWSTAPQLLGASLVQRAKPAAEVLAVNESLSIDGKPSVVAAVQRYGAGQTMIFTADTSWRWSRLPRVAGVSDTLYARFWSQTIRWLSGRGKDEERPLLALSTDRPAYDVGKPVTIRAVRQPRPDADLSSAEVGAEVTSPSGKPVPVPLRSSSAEPEVFTGTFYPTSGGRYELTGHLADKQGKPLANQAAEFLVHGSDLELADTGTNPANLKAIANLTGGVYADAADAAKLADKIARKERRTARIERSEFWNSPGLFVFFLAAVTGEWLIRRRNHLV